jgi:predicted secreted hydrolase
MKALVAGVAALLAVVAALTGTGPPRSAHANAHAPDTVRLELGPGPGLSGFARATEPRRFHLPEDHGPHFAFQTEWWYYTGNVVAADGRRFGFQVTFFRRGLSPGPPPQAEGLSTNQVYFAHFALTDVGEGRHRFAERFDRGAGGLAGARGEPFVVWLEDWRAEATNADGSTVRITARDGEVALDLALEARKPLVAHGNRGLSPKGDEPGNASYYVGYTRLGARGRIGADVREADVTGEAWFDHEWSTSALDPGAVGWDWFSLQLDDGRELMDFQVREDDGSVKAASGGTLVERDGGTRRLSRADVTLEVLGRWTSPLTGAVYPSRWRLRVPSGGLDLLVEPWLEAQEMRTSFLYWEGAVRVSGVAAGRPVAGQGYAELTGYARSMQGVF